MMSGIDFKTQQRARAHVDLDDIKSVELIIAKARQFLTRISLLV